MMLWIIGSTILAIILVIISTQTIASVGNVAQRMSDNSDEKAAKQSGSHAIAASVMRGIYGYLRSFTVPYVVIISWTIALFAIGGAVPGFGKGLLYVFIIFILHIYYDAIPAFLMRVVIVFIEYVIWYCIIGILNDGLEKWSPIGLSSLATTVVAIIMTILGSIWTYCTKYASGFVSIVIAISLGVIGATQGLLGHTFACCICMTAGVALLTTWLLNLTKYNLRSLADAHNVSGAFVLGTMTMASYQAAFSTEAHALYIGALYFSSICIMILCRVYLFFKKSGT